MSLHVTIGMSVTDRAPRLGQAPDMLQGLRVHRYYLSLQFLTTIYVDRTSYDVLDVFNVSLNRSILATSNPIAVDAEFLRVQPSVVR